MNFDEIEHPADRAFRVTRSKKLWSFRIASAKGQELTMDDSVAFAGSRFKLWPAEDRNHAALIGDDSQVAQSFGCEGDFGTRSAESNGERFVGHRKLALSYSVLNHQQAAGEPFLNAVETIADGGLGNLDQEIAEIVQGLEL
jgi:hypothetical protein